MSKKSLYIVILVISFISYGWLFFNFSVEKSATDFPSICLFKQATTIPCPACGTTRSVTSIVEGRVSEAILINPLGILAVLLLVLIPAWVIKDLVKNESSFYRSYKKTEIFIQKKYVASVFIAAIVANWAWNIMKEL